MGKAKHHRGNKNKFILYGFVKNQYNQFVQYTKENKQLQVDTNYSCTTNTVYLTIKVITEIFRVRISDHQQYKQDYDYEINPYSGNTMKRLLTTLDEIKQITKKETAA